MIPILEILKYSIPALVVFATVYYLFKNFLDHQYRIEDMRYQQSLGKDNHSIKVQALERLMMFSERMNIDNLYYRLISADVGPKELRSMMLIAIQQEYEHNATQQLYISDGLWKIIQLAKEQTQSVISNAEGNTTIEMMTDMHRKLAEAGANPSAFACNAIKNEGSLLLG